MQTPETVPLMQVAACLRETALLNNATAALPAPEREAAAFAYVLEHLPVAVPETELLAGDWHWRFAAEDTREAVAQVLERPVASTGEPSVLQLLDERFHLRAGWSPAHTCADYGRLLASGLAAVRADIDDALLSATGAPAETLRGMSTAVQAVIGFAHRLAALAEAQGRDELGAICRKVPEYPAETLREALQALWILHLAVGVSEYCDASLSLGRLDQYLLPLYERDLQRGIPPQELRGLLVELWHKLNRFGDPACAVNLGGLEAQGRDLWNPLSDLIVDVTREVLLPSPILAARVHAGLPAHAFEALLSPELLRIGQPTFYGEQPCREALVRRGVPAAEAHRFALNSCMGLVMPGEEIADMWGVVVNLLLPLELALDHGRPFAAALPLALQTPPRLGYGSFDEFYEQWASYLAELLDYLVDRQAEATRWIGRERPNPFFSALTADCIDRATDRAMGGVRYHGVTVEGFGWVNAADALTAIRRLVFEEDRYSLPELVAAAQADFVGHERLLSDLRACPKYGNAQAEADELAARVTDTFAALTTAHNRDNLHYLPSYHTLNAHVFAGRKLAASLDGRRAGQPLGKNAGPLPEHRRGPLTALLLSASTIDQRSLPGGQALDLSLDPKLLGTVEDREKLQALLLTYFQRGGLQVQVNGLGAEELRAAIAQPQAHRDLIVRIAGYSARFVELGGDVQREMVERFEVGL